LERLPKTSLLPFLTYLDFMDFLTSFPYWGILIVIIINAIIVSKMDIRIDDEEK